jgi:hypothetical protein
MATKVLPTAYLATSMLAKRMGIDVESQEDIMLHELALLQHKACDYKIYVQSFHRRARAWILGHSNVFSRYDTIEPDLSLWSLPQLTLCDTGDRTQD